MTKAETTRLQTYLKNAGVYVGRIDGLAGPMTVTAIKVFQRGHGLKEDGLAGPLTLAAMFGTAPIEPTAPVALPPPPVFWRGAGKRLDPTDIVTVARAIDVEPRALLAVLKVESRGSGFDAAGNVTALYEPHIAYRMATPAARLRLVGAKIAYPKWKASGYPKSSIARISEAAAIAGDELAADATSWGLWQIMGFNAKAAGYMTAVDMAWAFAADEENQLAGGGAYILNNKSAHLALQRRDWYAFGDAFNGAAARKHDYGGRIAKVYKASA